MVRGPVRRRYHQARRWNTLDCCLICPSVVSPLYQDMLCIVLHSVHKEMVFLLVLWRNLAQFSVCGVLGDGVIFIQHGEMGGIVSGFFHFRI